MRAAKHFLTPVSDVEPIYYPVSATLNVLCAGTTSVVSTYFPGDGIREAQSLIHYANSNRCRSGRGRMSVVLIRSSFLRKFMAVVSLWSFTATAQQTNSASSAQPQQPASGAATSQQPAAEQASIPNAPAPQALPKPTGVDYSKPASLLPNPFARYVPRDVPQPSFTNAPKLEQLIQNGKLMLSMDDAIAIAVSDNLDIAVARYNLPIADTDILRAKAGGVPLGVNAGVVSNTPGGGVGGIGAGVAGTGAGGTTAGAGGAGAGAGGIVGSTSGAGPQPDSFDPVLTGTFQITHATSPQTTTILTGTNILSQNQGI